MTQRPQSLGCAPILRESRTHAVLYRPGEVPAPGRAAPAHSLAFLQSSDAWRAKSLEGRRCIPAGYTYLAQLMGHDMGSSVRLSHLPRVAKAGQAAGAVGYNLIDNPLTLETVYGSGPSFATHLYDPETLLFRMDRHDRLTKTFGRGPDMLRALYDERNRDTRMLHELTAAVMQFHNRCAEALLADGLAPAEAYALGRAHVTKLWHKILREELLPFFVLPETLTQDLDPAFALDEVTLLHGLFRAFHALPLKHYPMGPQAVQRLPDMMKTGFEPSQAEAFHWRIHWAFFFATPGADVRLGAMEKPLTGLAFSAERTLMGPLGRFLMVADQDSARRFGALCIDSPEMRTCRMLLAQDTCEPQTLADGLAAIDGAPAVSKAALASAPVFAVLLAEAQLFGAKGRFGPLGSALFRASLEASIARVVFAEATERALADHAATLLQPATMLEMIQMGREERHAPQ